MRECVKLESSVSVTFIVTPMLYIHVLSHTYVHAHAHTHTLVVVEKVPGFLRKGKFSDSFPNRSLFSTSN